MGKFIDLTGCKFGRLTVLSKGKARKRSDKGFTHYWICECDCGNTVEVRGDDLKSGRTQGCGCYQRQRAKEYHTKHGMCGERIYWIWVDMKRRCKSQSRKCFDRYGGRGIAVCEEWKAFEPFYEWAIANGYREDLTIDRIDNDSDYCPENCRWATQKEQCNNTSSNHRITYNGETHTLVEWAEILGLPKSVMYDRTRRGWSMERIVNTPMRRNVDGHYVV